MWLRCFTAVPAAGWLTIWRCPLAARLFNLVFRMIFRPLCAALCAVVWCAALAAQPATPASPLQGTEVVLQGTVVLPAQQTEVVSLPVAGVVQALLVSPMALVRAGQPLARVLSPQLADMQREWRTAAAQARLARSKAERDEALFKEGIVAELRRNESVAQAEMADLAAQERRQALRLAGVSEARLLGGQDALSPQLDISAPTGGTVLELLATPGQRLEAGSPLLRLGRADKWVIEFQASAAQLQGMRVGDVLAVDGCSKAARVSAISPQVSATQNLQARAELVGREDCLRLSQFVQLRWQRAGAR